MGAEGRAEHARAFLGQTETVCRVAALRPGMALPGLLSGAGSLLTGYGSSNLAKGTTPFAGLFGGGNVNTAGLPSCEVVDNPSADAFVKNARERFGMKLLSRRDGFAEALKILRRKGFVGVLFDQNAGLQGAHQQQFLLGHHPRKHCRALHALGQLRWA